MRKYTTYTKTTRVVLILIQKLHELSPTVQQNSLSVHKTILTGHKYPLQNALTVHKNTLIRHKIHYA